MNILVRTVAAYRNVRAPSQMPAIAFTGEQLWQLMPRDLRDISFISMNEGSHVNLRVGGGDAPAFIRSMCNFDIG